MVATAVAIAAATTSTKRNEWTDRRCVLSVLFFIYCVRTQRASFGGEMTKCKERGDGEGAVDFKKKEKRTENEQSVIFE